MSKGTIAFLLIIWGVIAVFTGVGTIEYDGSLTIAVIGLLLMALGITMLPKGD